MTKGKNQNGNTGSGFPSGAVPALGLCLWLCLSCPFVAWAEGASAAKVEKLFLEGRYDTAVAEAGRLIDGGASGGEELHYIKGVSELKIGRLKEARMTFEYMRARYAGGKRSFDADVGIGDSYLLEGDYETAIRVYQEILKKYPNNRNLAAVYYRLGISYGRAGSASRSDEYFALLKRTSPLSFEARMSGPRAVFQKVPFSVQAGCFKNRDNAEKLATQLKQAGFAGYVEKTGPAGGLYRVKVGRPGSREEATGLSARLERAGYETKICDGE